MQEKEMKTTDGQIWLPAPYQTTPSWSSGAIQGIWINPLQDVEWIWTHTPGGSYVSGYTVKNKPLPEKFKEKNDTV